MSNYTDTGVRCVFVCMGAKANMWNRKRGSPVNRDMPDRFECVQQDPWDSPAHEGTYFINLQVTLQALLVCQQRAPLTAASAHAPLWQSRPNVTPSDLLCSTSVGFGGCWGWPLIVRFSLCGRTPHCTEKRKRKAFSNSRSCPSAPGNNRSRGRRPAWPILALS